MRNKCQGNERECMGLGAKHQTKAGEWKYQGNVWEWVQSTRECREWQGNVCMVSARGMHGNSRDWVLNPRRMQGDKG